MVKHGHLFFSSFIFLQGVTALHCVLCSANKMGVIQGCRAAWWGASWGWLRSAAAVCLSVCGAACSYLQHGRPLAVLPRLSWTGGAPAQLVGNGEEQRPCPSWKLVVDEDSSSCFSFCDLSCPGTCRVPGCATRSKAQTPSLHTAKAAEKAHAPRAVVNLGRNGALLSAGGGDSPPASPRPPQHSFGCPPHILPACDSSSSPRDWAGGGSCWRSLRRPGAKSSTQGRCNPNLSGLDTFNPSQARSSAQPWDEAVVLAWAWAGAGPSKTSHVPGPAACPSHVLAPCWAGGPSQNPQRCTPTSTMAVSILRS